MSMNTDQRPDVSRIKSTLKDFQRRTVDHVFRRMYLDDDASRRFLVADEVGLGKTLVARGVIAQAVDHLWDQVDRIDVVYICSNGDIARQNINRLNFTKEAQFEFASRLTLLPSDIHNLNKNRLNFISFTPGTSFNLRSQLGRKEERLLLYWLLHNAWGLDGSGPYNVLQGEVADFAGFRDDVHKFGDRSQIDEGLMASFCEALEKRAEEERVKGKTTIRERFDELCSDMQYARKHPRNYPSEVRDRQKVVVGELRKMVARVCVDALEPDLIILDEFQRFRDLLSEENDAGLLAKALFDYSDDDTEARLLLLSATPYKAYTTSHESADDHYEDFIRTVEFLENNPTGSKKTQLAVKSYRRELFRVGNGTSDRLKEAAARLQRRLQRVMMRTERLASSTDRNGMLEEVRSGACQIDEHDVQSFVALSAVATELGSHGTVEYWKSSPYLLSFMDGYDLKRRFKEALEAPNLRESLLELKLRELFLASDTISKYARIDPKNARLRALLDRTVNSGLWRLLWLPPSLPYYQLEAPFNFVDDQSPTKQLVFSAWHVVPKMIATTLSYCAEERIFRAHEDDPENTAEARRRRRPLLRFAVSDGRLTGMPVLSLIYPSFTLAERFDPAGRLQDGGSSLSEVIHALEEDIQLLLDEITDRQFEEEGADEAWYWAAPLLLDLNADSESAKTWFFQPDLYTAWVGHSSGDDGKESKSRFADHIDHARKLARGELELGPPPPDLAEVLAHLALAGPGVVALRALGRIGEFQAGLRAEELRNASGRLAWNALSLFNTPEAMAIIRGLNPAEPYWRRVLEYAAAGCIQAVFDEYVHILRESLGLIDETAVECAAAIGDEIGSALSLRTASMSVDEISSTPDDISLSSFRMRAHFAARFGDNQTEETGQMRAGHLRTAFNSPFWPFVLATTSVGQEGLDFHPYCHAVVHWNLPSNPVDLEQREGRVHRYKGHAVRKNVASAHREVLHAENGANGNLDGDPWQALFRAAAKERPTTSSEIVPYWVYALENGAKIERHVPLLPLSRDAQRLSHLRRALASYRMVFGQARQEDLLAYLLEHLSDESAEEFLEACMIDLSPPNDSPT